MRKDVIAYLRHADGYDIPGFEYYAIQGSDLVYDAVILNGTLTFRTNTEGGMRPLDPWAFEEAISQVGVINPRIRNYWKKLAQGMQDDEDAWLMVDTEDWKT